MSTESKNNINLQHQARKDGFQSQEQVAMKTTLRILFCILSFKRVGLCVCNIIGLSFKTM